MPSHLFFKTSFWLVLLKKVVLSTADFWHAETPGYHTSLWLLWICRGILSHTNSPWSSRVLHILLFIDNVLDLEVSLLILIIPQSFLSMLEVRNVYNTGFQRFKLYSLFSIWRLSRQSQGFPHNIYSEKNEETRVSIPYYPFIIKYYTLNCANILPLSSRIRICLQYNTYFFFIFLMATS